jgi:hypothetical protein
MPGSAHSRRSEHAWSVEHKHRQRAEAALAERANDDVTQADIDETLEETFPASDPPSWAALARIGSPRRTHDA